MINLRLANIVTMNKCTCVDKNPLDCPIHGDEILKGIKEGIKAMKEGRVTPWEDVKKELGLD